MRVATESAHQGMRELRGTVQLLPSPVRVMAGFLRYNLVYPMLGRPLSPRAMCLYVTYRCNLRCRMCGIWNVDQETLGREWSLNELDEFLTDNLFSLIEFVNLNGGEPNLRQDLPEIAALLLERLPKLRNLTLNTNGIPPDLCVKNCERILDVCRAKGVRFGASVSLHSVGSSYDEIAGIPDAFNRVTRTLEGLKRLREGGGFFLSVNCVLTPLSIAGAREMLDWGRREDIPVNFTVGEVRERFNNLDMTDSVDFDTAPEREILVSFLRDLGKQRGRLFHHAVRYRELASMVAGKGHRTLACHYALAGLILGSDGSLYYCKKSKAIGNLRDAGASEIYWGRANLDYRREELINGGCPTCLPNTFNFIEVQKDLLKLLRLLR